MEQELYEKAPTTQVPEVPVSAPPKSNNLILIIVIILLTVALSVAGTYLYILLKISPQIPQPGVSPQPTNAVWEVSPTPVNVLPSGAASSSATTTACGYPDSGFCLVWENIRAAIVSKNTAYIPTVMQTQSVTCDPDGMSTPICEGVAQGEVRTGYAVGYVQSEGAIYAEPGFAKVITDYINTNPTLKYHGTKFTETKAVMVFLDQDKQKLIGFPMVKISESWRISLMLLGTPTDDYINLTDAVLGY